MERRRERRREPPLPSLMGLIAMTGGLCAVLASGGSRAVGRSGFFVEPGRLGALRRDFPYRDRELLRPGHRRGGRLWLPPEARRARGSLPVLVVLHGLNADGDLHRLLGGDDDGYDVTRPVARLVADGRVAPLVVAAPSQSARAWNGRWMWPRFDLAHFLGEVERHLPPGQRLSRRRVIVAAHSAAGCNPHGGLYDVLRRHRRPLALVASVDTCMSPGLGRTVRRYLPATVPFWAVWQPRWPRAVGAFERALGLGSGADVVDVEAPEASPVPLQWQGSAWPGVRRLRQAGSRLVLELVTRDDSRWGNHLDALTRFVELVLPRLLPGPATRDPGR